MSFFDCRPKSGLQFVKFGFENSKNAFFQKIKMVYARSALTMLFGMLFCFNFVLVTFRSIFGFQNQNPNFAQTSLRPVGAESRLLAKLQNSILKQEIGFSTPKLREK